MKYLIDANVLSEPTKTSPNLLVVDWLRAHEPDIRKAGKTMPVKDSLIAATAIVHDPTVATRNRIDFAKAGVRVVDPFVA